jgi:hypothetical protein
MTKAIKSTFASLVVISVVLSVLTPAVYATSGESSSSSSSRSSTSTSRTSSSSRTSTSSTRSAESESSESSKSSSSLPSFEDSQKGTNTALNAYKAAKTTEKVAKLKEFANKVIDERISFLQNKLTNKIRVEKFVSDAEKTELLGYVNDAITELQTAKTEINAETDLVKLKEMVKGIYSEHKVYGVVGPKLMGLLAAYRLDYLATKLGTTLDTLGIRLEENKDKLTNYTQMKAYLDSSKTELTSAKASITSAIAKFKEMDPANTRAMSDKSLGEGRAFLAKARVSINKIKEYLGKIRALIEVVKSSSSSETTTSETTSSTSSGD